MLLQLEKQDNPTKDGSPLARALFEKLAIGEEEEKLSNFAFENGGTQGLSEFYFYLIRLQERALVRFTAGTADAPLATLVPMKPLFSLDQSIDVENQTYELSRFCLLRRENEEFVLETPLAPAYLIVRSHEVLLLLSELKARMTFPEICQRFSELSSQEIKDCLVLLTSLRAFTFCENGYALEQWEFQDLFFHTRSRVGRHNHPYGGVYPFKEKISPLPVVKPSTGTREIPLYRPDLDELKSKDLSFTEVLEKRCSKREPGAPVNVQILGEFLYRSARIKKILQNPFNECSCRPSPGGGAIHELEIYPIVNRCGGLEPGVYHYNPLSHTLSHIAENNAYVEQLFADVGGSTMKKELPQILFVFTARFQRIAWKYRSISYAVTLKNVGVLTQTMYLVATAMSLSPCAIGGGDSDLFSKLIQSDYYEETSVGEFILS